MDSTTQSLLFALLGAVLGAGVVLAWRVSEWQLRHAPEAAASVLPVGVAGVLGVLRSSALVVAENDSVLKASAPAHALHLVRGGQLTVPELAGLVRSVRRDGEIRDIELVLGSTHVDARVAPMGRGLVLVLVEDRTRERRVEAIRRDFVANVSHELKTPVGAIGLLAEAVREARDEPDAVDRFAGRMLTESGRLSRLVQQIIELSRLQIDDPLDHPAPVGVAAVVARAVDQNAIDAQAKDITLATDVAPTMVALGAVGEITLAVSNLVANAVSYSPEHSTVLVAARADGAMVELTVTDQGIGIPAEELDRIFERFYRVDPARDRSTGGTGLGLSIVKHVAASHGGEIRVWSEPGQGSTFTLRLPRRTTEGGLGVAEKETQQ